MPNTMPRGGDKGGRKPRLPPDEKRKIVSFTLSPAEYELAKRLGGSRAVGVALELAEYLILNPALLNSLKSIAVLRGIGVGELVEDVLVDCLTE